MKLFFKIIFSVCLISFSASAQTLEHNASWQFRAAVSSAPIVDNLGNVYLADNNYGYILGFDLDPGAEVQPNITADTPNDFFAVSLNSQGAVRWLKMFGTPGETKTAEIIRHFGDAQGNTYLAGRFSDTLFLEGFTLIAHGPSLDTTSCVFLIKLDTDGAVVWAQQFGNNQRTVLENACNNGEYTYTATRQNYTYPNTPNTLITKFDAFGNQIWSKTLVGTSLNTNEFLYGMHADSSGNLIMSGKANGSIDYDPGTGTTNVNPGANAAYICKWSADGDFNWVKTIRLTQNLLPCPGIETIRSDNHGGYYFLGDAGGIMDADPGPGISNLGTIDTYSKFLLKLNNDGIFQWAREFDSAPPTAPASSILIDGASNVLVGGITNTGSDLDPGPGITTGIKGFYIIKLSPDGDFFWAHQSESSASANVNKLAIDPQKQFIYSGVTYSALVTPIVGLTFNAAPGNQCNLISKWEDTMCSDFGLNVDSTQAITCADPSSGQAWAHSFGGETPYIYSWNDGNQVNDSTATFSESGFYTVSSTDARGCIRTSTVLIAAPDTSLNGPDLKVTTVNSTWDLRPGQLFNTYLDVLNKGCDAVSGSLFLVHDSITVFQSSVPMPDNIYGDTLVWNFTDLNSDNSSFNVEILFLGDSTLADSVFALGQDFCNQAYVSPSVDVNSSDNSMIRCGNLVNSYDPNDIQVYPSGECTSLYVRKDEVLTYTIRFQNTGSAEAINVQILDTLPAVLDITSIRIAGQSHPGLVTQILPGNILRFKFDNINLPDSTANELESHGYINYEIVAYASTPDGTVLNNRAAIYFDFNDPVITNTSTITLVGEIPIIDNTVFQSGDFLIANGEGYSYQWIDCSNGNLEIEGETSQQFLINQPGAYAVSISSNGCSAVSECIPILILNDGLSGEINFSVFPNPAIGGQCTVSLPENYEKATVEILNVVGQVLAEYTTVSNAQIQVTLPEAAGLYFIHVITPFGHRGVKKVLRY
jgi:uncharacterized repeat protein (TIGR01451 family)